MAVRLDHSERPKTIPTRVLAISRGSEPVEAKPNLENISLRPINILFLLLSTTTFSSENVKNVVTHQGRCL